jgi:hypothetical protein
MSVSALHPLLCIFRLLMNTQTQDAKAPFPVQHADGSSSCILHTSSIGRQQPFVPTHDSPLGHPDRWPNSPPPSPLFVVLRAA